MKQCAQITRATALLVLLACCSSEDGFPGPPILVPFDGGAADVHQELPETGPDPSEEEELCLCLVVACDRLFHEEFGVGHDTSIQACEIHLQGLPHLAEPAEAGDSFECRAHWCQLARSNASLCPAAFGQVVCI